MLNSMTGYGRGTASRNGREITVEVKSVNHRYLDLGMRLPRHIAFLEDAFRTILGQQVSRGHIDIFVNYRNTRNDARTVEIDSTLLQLYVTSARAANELLGLRDDITLSTALRLPDVTNVIEQEEDREEVTALAGEALMLAIAELKKMRAQEGERMRLDLSEHLQAVSSLREQIATRAPLVVEEYRQKLLERVEKLLDTTEVDRARLATEVALFADKASIDEEIVRLGSHVEQMKLVLNGSEPAGRRLDFIVQEMNREFNTIGSKANDAQLVNWVLLGKGEVEKLREQIQNIE